MGSGYKVHTFDGQAGEVPGAPYRTHTVNLTLPGPTAAGSFVVWRAPRAATVTAVRGYRAGGTTASVNAATAGGDVLASDLPAGNASWASSTTLQNTAIAAGGSLTLELAAVSGTPTYVSIQVDVEYNAPA